MAAGFGEGFLSNLGRGFQTAGAILSPAVYEQQSKERMLEREAQLRQQAAIQQIIARAVESGSMAPEAASAFGLSGLRASPAAQNAQLQLGQAQREAAVFTPENIARNMQPGQPAAAWPGSEFSAGGEQAAIEPRVNMAALREQSARTGVKGMEAYSTHMATEALRAATIDATRQARAEAEAQARTREDNQHEVRMANATTNADRAAESARHNRVVEGFTRALRASGAAAADRPLSPIGKLGADYRAGRITKEEYESELRGGTGGMDPGATAPAVPASATAVPAGTTGSAATGGSGFFGGLANTAADMGGFKMPYPGVEQATQALKNLKIQTITLAQDAVPGRPSNYMMKKLEELAVEPNSLFMADQRSRVRLEQTRAMLQQEVSRMEREILERPQQYTPSVLSKTRNSHGQLRQLVGEYNTVIDSFGDGKKGPTASGKIGAPPARRATDAPSGGIKFLGFE